MIPLKKQKDLPACPQNQNNQKRQKRPRRPRDLKTWKKLCRLFVVTVVTSCVTWALPRVAVFAVAAYIYLPKDTVRDVRQMTIVWYLTVDEVLRIIKFRNGVSVWCCVSVSNQVLVTQTVLWFVNLFQDDRHLQDSGQWSFSAQSWSACSRYVLPPIRSKELKAAAACDFSCGSTRPHRHPESPTEHSSPPPQCSPGTWYWHFYICYYGVRAFLQ